MFQVVTELLDLEFRVFSYSFNSFFKTHITLSPFTIRFITLRDS